MQQLVVHFTSSLVLSLRYSVYGKKGQNSEVIKEDTSKGRDVYPSNGQTLFQCHHYQLLPCSQLCMCRIATYNSVSRLSWSFVKEYIVSSYRLTTLSRAC